MPPILFICSNCISISSKLKLPPFAISSPFSRLFLCRFCVQLLRPKKARHPCPEYAVPHVPDGMAQEHPVFAHTEELDWLASNRTNRQCCTTTRITISFSQDHTRQRKCIVKCFGCICRILTGHGIDHEQGFSRINRCMQLFNLFHHIVIDMQTTCGIDNQYIGKLDFCLFNCTINDTDWFSVALDSRKIAPTSPATVCSCLIAAGR